MHSHTNSYINIYHDVAEMDITVVPSTFGPYGYMIPGDTGHSFAIQHLPAHGRKHIMTCIVTNKMFRINRFYSSFVD